MDAATVLWLPTPTEQAPDAPSRREAARHALDEWARARGLRLTPPREETTRTLPVDLALADRVELELEAARDAVSALDADAAERALARADGILRAHPELPEGAWLMAEVLRGWASRWARVPPVAPDRALEAWRAAEGLDGGRVPGIGESAAPSSPSLVEAALVLAGEGDAWLDGTKVTSGPIKKTEGLHHLVVAREAGVVWADWISLAPGATVEVAVPPSPPCSKEELARVTLEGGAVHAPYVLCPSWVAAVPGAASGGLLVSTCHEGHCGALLEWSVGGTSGTPAGPVDHGRGWPAWATWTIVGASVVTVAAVTLVAAGVFQAPATQTQFVNGGLHVQ